MPIAREVIQIVPAHSIYISLAQFIRKLRMMPHKKSVQILIIEKILLLDDLSIHIRRTQSLDLRHKKITYSFYSLKDVLAILDLDSK